MQRIQAPLIDVYGDWQPRTLPAVPPPAPSSGRRRLIGPTVAIAVALLVGAFWWNKAATADPGLRFSEPAVFLSGRGDEPGIRQFENRLGREVEVDFARAVPFTVVLKLTNGRSHDVRLREIPRTTFYDWAIDRVSWSSSEDEDSEREDAASEPFQPFTLTAGESVDIRLESRFADCDLTGGGILISPSQINALPVTYKAWGFLRTIDVPFERAMLSFFAAGDCDRQIVRN